MKRFLAAGIGLALLAGCMTPAASKQNAHGKAAPQLKNEAEKARQLPLVLPDTINDQNHKQKLQAFESELKADRDSGGRAYVDAGRK